MAQIFMDIATLRRNRTRGQYSEHLSFLIFVFFQMKCLYVIIKSQKNLDFFQCTVLIKIWEKKKVYISSNPGSIALATIHATLVFSPFLLQISPFCHTQVVSPLATLASVELGWRPEPLPAITIPPAPRPDGTSVTSKLRSMITSFRIRFRPPSTIPMFSFDVSCLVKYHIVLNIRRPSYVLLNH